MQFKSVTFASLAAASVAAAEYVAGEPWSTLTPSATYKCAATEYTKTFGIAVQKISGNAKRDVISQIGDGQIQATATTTLAPTTKAATTTTKASTKVSSSKASSSSACATSPITFKDTSCKNDGTLQLALKDGVLTDAKGRIGAIVSNRQFQFDGPPPQAGTILAAGWSITEDGNLALGDKDVFYQCLSGNFYNLYDQSIAEQCSPIHLEVVELVDC